MEQRMPLMFLPLKLSKRIGRLFKGITIKLSRIVPGIRYDLEETDLPFDEEEYLSVAFVNSLFLFLILFFLLSFLNYQNEPELVSSLSNGAMYAFTIFFILLYTMLRYPRILAGKKAEMIDKHLIYALKDLLLQITSGVTLYNGLVNVAKAGYGQASEEFKKVAKSVNTGTPIDKALERMAIESKSEFLRRTTWQLINTLKAGASLKGALKTLIDDLTIEQRNKIKQYATELNLWTLVYMLFSVAIPTIGATMMIILSSFAGFGITKGIFILFIIICLIIQVVLIGFVKTRRPMVNL